MATLGLLVEAAFVVLFCVSAVSLLQHRDRLRLDVFLVFASIAVLFVLQVFRLVAGDLPPLVGRLAGLALLAHAPLSLRLASDLAPIGRRVRNAAWLGYGVLGLALLTLDLQGPLTLGSIGYFVAVDGFAAWSLAGAAQRRAGSARTRLLAAACGTAAMALALLTLGAALLEPSLQAITSALVGVVALAAAMGYLAAFLPPPALRRVFGSGRALSASRQLLVGSDSISDDAWARLARLAMELTDAEGVVLYRLSETEAGLRLAAAGSAEAAPSSLSGPAVADLGASDPHGRELPARAAPAHVLALAQVAPRSVRVLPLVADDAHRVVGVLFHRYHSLFSDDDRALLELLASEAAALADRETALAEAAALGSRLSATVEALRNASQAKSDFLASMSHELRTPLNAILGFSDLMRSEPMEGERRIVPGEWIEHVHGAGQHLLALINDVLDLAKVEAGRIELQPEPLDLHAAVGEAVAGLRPLADHKRLTLISEVRAESVVADRGRLRQVLYNLLSNAIKYTPEGGSVRIEAEPTADGVSVAVIDTGVGIAPEDQARVFEEFTQVGDPALRQEGTGLGLALTRRLIAAHGGSLGVSSTLGEGSRFWFVLPAAAAKPEGILPPILEPVATDPGPGYEERAPVLLIEDDLQASQLVATYLGHTPFRLEMAAGGVDGIAAARRLRPSAILLDVLLPDIDGWEVLRRLKADPELRDVPVVVLTVVDERELGLALGAVDYLLKPVSRETLLEALRRCLPGQAVSQLRVLAIDDDPASLELLRSGLETAGAEVTTANGGRAAIRAAAGGGYDLVICDLLMPEIDGFEVVAQLKAAAATSDTPILVLTAHQLTEADKARLNGRVIGVCEKGPEAGRHLRAWLERVAAPPSLLPAA